MKKYLLSQNGRFYKANLHCHTTLSDACWTPEKVKEEYMKRGYSVVAYTDHDILIPHPELCDDNFVALNGYEMEISETCDPFAKDKCCHMCLVALEPDNIKQVCYHREKYLFCNAVKYRGQLCYDDTLPDYEREYTPEKISEMMQIGRDNGFFVTYNHPGWSMETPAEYLNYHGMHAMEILNGGSYRGGYCDYNEKEYDMMLRNGERIYCIAADDNHNSEPVDCVYSSSFGGFVMIKAEKLEYKAITDALIAGNFYSSEGPEIYDLWVEDGKIHITCSDVKKITLSGNIRPTLTVFREDDKPLTEATFDVNPNQKYIRITLTDAEGKHANTNAYFIDELLND